MEFAAISKILPNPEQPRKQFNQVALTDLANSIRENGVIVPLIVEEAGNDHFILHDGERRLRAAKLAHLDIVPIKKTPPLNGTGKQDRLIRAMVANVQREDLNPIEEARAYQRMIDELGMNVAQITRKVGTNFTRVENRLKLLKLEKEITQKMETGELSHDGRLTDALLSLPDKVTRVKVAEKIIEKRMTITSSIKMIEKINNHLAEDHLESGEVPAMRFATKQAGEPRKAVWDAFSAVGKLPPWILFQLSVRDTCKECSLSDMASETTCKDCPMVFLVRSMIGSTK